MEISILATQKMMSHMEFVYLNGNSFSGHRKSGEKHGNGTFQYKDGSSYSGEWKTGELINVSGLEFNRSQNSSTND